MNKIVPAMFEVPIMKKRPFLMFLLSILPLVAAACGGGGSAPPPPPPLAAFLVNVPLGTAVLATGATSSIQVGIQGVNGFSGTVSVTVSGLPSGVTASTIQVPANSSGSITLTASASAATGNSTLTFTGTSGSLTNNAFETLEVGPPANFQLSGPPIPEVDLRFGSSDQIGIGISACCSPAVGGYPVSLSVSGLPTGVTATFSSNPVSAGQTSTLTLTAPPNGQFAQNHKFIVTASTSVPVPNPTQQLTLFLDLAPPPGNLPNNRTDFIRTDGKPVSMVYDPVHQLIFASNLEWNRIDVVSLVTKQIVRSIAIPAPQGLDLTIDGKQLIVGTQTQQIIAIDTTKLVVTQKWNLPDISYPGLGAGQHYGTLKPLVLSNGKVLILWNLVFTTLTGIIEWDPASNSVSAPALPANFIGPGGMARSGDGTKVIIFTGDSGGNVVIFDAATNSVTAQRIFNDFVFGVVVNPNGTRFIALDEGNGLALYDANLNAVGPIPPGNFDTGVVFSSDGNTIYVVADANGVPATFTVNTNTLQLVGIAPAYATIPPHEELSPPYFIEVPFAVDSTGLIFGAADHGIALDDSTYFQTLGGPSGTPVFDKLVQPDAGPINASTQVQVFSSPFNTLPDAWFGAQRALNETTSGTGGALQMSSPPSSQPGPVNLKFIEPNGIQVFDPLAFSYGPAPLFLVGDAASPAGGASTDILAVGVPSDASLIHVTVGGAAATVISASDFPSAFPAVDIKATLPSGLPGPADITVTTTAGSATLPKAFHFLQSVTDYSSSDTFQTILYDRFRNQVYLSAGDHVDVFSLASKQFQTPFALPSANGKKQFAGMALTPDGSKLIVTNLLDGSVDILSPDTPAGAVAVPISPALPGPPCSMGPAFVATTNTGKAFILFGGVPGLDCGPGGSNFELDLTSLAVTQRNDVCRQGNSFVSSSRDGSVISFGGSGWVIYDSATNSCVSSSFYQPYGAATSGDGNIFAAGFRITGPGAQLTNIMAFPDPYYSAQIPGTPQGNGEVPLMEEKMNDSGSLLYVPYANSFEILDMNHAILSRRISLSEQIPTILDALAINITGQEIYLITNKGLTIVDLDSVPLSIGSVSPASNQVGAQITVRGSGFVQGSTAKLNGTASTVTFVDANTLLVTIPSLSSGAVQIQVSNPDGTTYILDNAFIIP
jgi:DNA-binding beta-propeller fold protein YncE